MRLPTQQQDVVVEDPERHDKADWFTQALTCTRNKVVKTLDSILVTRPFVRTVSFVTALTATLLLLYPVRRACKPMAVGWCSERVAAAL